jgi:hypothetical protein
LRMIIIKAIFMMSKKERLMVKLNNYEVTSLCAYNLDNTLKKEETMTL